MRLRFLRCFSVFVAALLVFPAFSFARHPRSCISTDEALQKLNKDICLSAYVYDVVQLSDETSFLDVCPSDTSDEHCRAAAAPL